MLLMTTRMIMTTMMMMLIICHDDEDPEDEAHSAVGVVDGCQRVNQSIALSAMDADAIVVVSGLHDADGGKDPESLYRGMRHLAHSLQHTRAASMDPPRVLWKT
jgi:hypothetical protein